MRPALFLIIATMTDATIKELNALQLKVKFSPVIKQVEYLTVQFNEHSRKELRRFSFSYAFDTWEGESIFTFLFDFNGGFIQSTSWRADDYDAFYCYCRALRHTAYAMDVIC